MNKLINKTFIISLIASFTASNTLANELLTEKKLDLGTTEFEQFVEKRKELLEGKDISNGMRKIAEIQLGINYCPFKNWSNTPLVAELGFMGLRKVDIEKGGRAYQQYSNQYETVFSNAGIFKFGAHRALNVCDNIWNAYGTSGKIIKGVFISRSDIACSAPSKEKLTSLQSPNILEEELPEIIRKAEIGNIIAQYELGVAYFQGKVADQTQAKNFEDGLKWIKKSANQGYVFAQFSLSMFYGAGKQKNVDLYLRWLTKAAEQKKYSSHTNLLGASYGLDTHGLTKNPELRNKWKLITVFLERQEECNN